MPAVVVGVVWLRGACVGEHSALWGSAPNTDAVFLTPHLHQGRGTQPKGGQAQKAWMQMDAMGARTSGSRLRFGPGIPIYTVDNCSGCPVLAYKVRIVFGS